MQERFDTVDQDEQDVDEFIRRRHDIEVNAVGV